MQDFLVKVRGKLITGLFLTVYQKSCSLKFLCSFVTILVILKVVTHLEK